jgi:hypothetical protein
MTTSFSAARIAALIGRPGALTALAVATLLWTPWASSPASADVGTVKCGQTRKTVSKSMYNDQYMTSSSTFKNISSAKLTVNVPNGQTQCLKIRFTALSSCKVATSNQHCFVKLTTPNYSFGPAAIVLNSSETLSSNSYEWVVRFNAGSHPIQAQASTEGDFTISTWTLTIEVTD